MKKKTQDELKNKTIEKTGKTKKKGNKKALKITLFSMLGVLVLSAAGIYVYMGNYYSSHFYSGTIINGVDCGEKQIPYIKEILKKQAEEYSLTIQEKDGKEEVIQASDIKIAYKDNGELEKIMDGQKPWLWFMSLGKNKQHEVTLENSYDTKSLDAFIGNMASLKTENMTAPKDAYIEDTGTAYQIVPEVEGNTMDPAKAKQAILDAVEGRDSVLSLADAECYQLPAIKQDDESLIKEADSLNKVTSMQITVDFGSGQEVIGRDLLKTWIKKDETGNYIFDEALVKPYVIDWSSKYNTYANPRDFITSSGQAVYLSTGDYGWKVWQDETTVSLMAALNAGQSTTIQATYLYKGQKHGGNDIDGTYVEISINGQHMWFYKNGNLIVDTPVVTGNPNSGHGTPSGGVWRLKDKASPFTLVGKKPDGSIDYEEPVTFWMPFNGGVGIHDLTKRDAFGGDIYLTNGSHGCINTPYDAVRTIYQNIEVNTPIIVY